MTKTIYVVVEKQNDRLTDRFFTTDYSVARAQADERNFESNSKDYDVAELENVDEE